MGANRIKTQTIYIYITQKDLYSDAIPVDVRPGNQVNWMVELTEEDNWVEKFYKDVLMPSFRTNLFRLRFIVYASRGKAFKVKIGKTLKDTFIELHTNKQKEKNT